MACTTEDAGARGMTLCYTIFRVFRSDFGRDLLEKPMHFSKIDSVWRGAALK